MDTGQEKVGKFMIPEIINYLLTLTYPDSDPRRLQPICYMGAYQLIIPVFPPGQTINLVGGPLHGVYAWLDFNLQFGSDMVPNVFAASGSQYGSTTYSGVLTQRFLNESHLHFVLVTDQEPSTASISNISPLAQRYDAYGEYLVISSPQDMEVISDALRRLHTSQESERLLQQADYLLGILSGQPSEPRPSVGGN